MGICMCGHTLDVVIYSKFHRNPLRGFGAPGVEICPFPLLWLLAFTTACTTVQAVMPSMAATYIHDSLSSLAVMIEDMLARQSRRCGVYSARRAAVVRRCQTGRLLPVRRRPVRLTAERRRASGAHQVLHVRVRGAGQSAPRGGRQGVHGSVQRRRRPGDLVQRTLCG